MDAQTIQVIISGIVGLLSGTFGKGLLDHARESLTGRARKRRDEVDRAWTRADLEARHRRILAESLSTHRRIIIEAPCLSADDLPPYPTAPGQTGPIPIKETDDD